MDAQRLTLRAHLSSTIDRVTERLAALGYLPSKAITPDQRRRILQGQAKEARKWEPVLSTAALQAFTYDKRNSLAILTRGRKKSLTRKATVDWDDLSAELAQYYGNASETEWADLFAPIYRGIIEDTAKRWSIALGISFDVQNLSARDYFNQAAIKFAQEVSDTTERDIAQIMAQAQANGASVAQVQKQFDALFDRYMSGELPPGDFEWLTDRTPAYRKELIARTEFTKSSNSGTFELMTEWKAPRKEWLTAVDGRERDSHRAANGQVVNMSEPFSVGGVAMMFPGDPTAPIGELANCRCTFAPVLE